MKVMATPPPMSFAEFERLDFGAEQLELLQGKLVRVPPPYADHMEMVERLYGALKTAIEAWRRAERLGKVHIEMGYLLQGEPRSWLRPDVSLTFPDRERDRFYLGAPLSLLPGLEIPLDSIL
jgi:Uma2 family endonuclease